MMDKDVQVIVLVLLQVIHVLLEVLHLHQFAF